MIRRRAAIARVGIRSLARLRITRRRFPYQTSFRPASRDGSSPFVSPRSSHRQHCGTDHRSSALHQMPIAVAAQRSRWPLRQPGTSTSGAGQTLERRVTQSSQPAKRPPGSDDVEEWKYRRSSRRRSPPYAGLSFSRSKTKLLSENDGDGTGSLRRPGKFEQSSPRDDEQEQRRSLDSRAGLLIISTTRLPQFEVAACVSMTSVIISKDDVSVLRSRRRYRVRSAPSEKTPPA